MFAKYLGQVDTLSVAKMYYRRPNCYIFCTSSVSIFAVLNRMRMYYLVYIVLLMLPSSINFINRLDYFDEILLLVQSHYTKNTTSIFPVKHAVISPIFCIPGCSIFRLLYVFAFFCLNTCANKFLSKTKQNISSNIFQDFFHFTNMYL